MRRSLLLLLFFFRTHVLLQSTICLQPEVGGLVVRMPLEVEIIRNRKHSLMGRKLHRQLTAEGLKNQTKFDKSWYYKAQKMVEDEMKRIASQAHNGQIDASALSDLSNDMLQLYLDQQVRDGKVV